MEVEDKRGLWLAVIIGTIGIAFILMSLLSGCKTVTLNWDHPGGADGFRIYFTNMPGTYDSKNVFLVDDGTARSSKLQYPDDVKCFKLQAFNDHEESAFSEEACIK